MVLLGRLKLGVGCWMSDAGCRVSGVGRPKTEVRRPVTSPITISPQPCKIGQVVLISMGQAGIQEISILDAAGKAVDRIDNPAQVVQWIPRKMEPGIYYLHLNTTQGKLFKKITVIE